MENETNSTPVPVVPVAVPAAPTATATAPAVPTAPAAPAFDPRRRIRELLAIPDRDRTDAEWDELNELEIQTAPGNRSSGQPPAAYVGKPNFPAKNRPKGKGPHNRSGGGGARPQQQPKQGGQGNQGGQGGQGNNNPQKPRPA